MSSSQPVGATGIAEVDPVRPYYSERRCGYVCSMPFALFMDLIGGRTVNYQIISPTHLSFARVYRFLHPL